ncbi:MAG: hypothetical protein R3B96_02975 [Pirellulaceae bacterium]
MEELRDYLYSQMRGAKGLTTDANATPNTPAAAAEVTQLLSDIRDAFNESRRVNRHNRRRGDRYRDGDRGDARDDDRLRITTPADMVPSRDVGVAASDGAVELASEPSRKRS